jgi:D-alanyl-D-alanine carboxypeptidase
MKELNLFLSQIGCANTTFTNPHGLPDDEHMTTAADLAKMAYYATKYPFFCSVVNKTKYEYPATNKQPAFWMTQSNELLRPGKYYYPYATGIKTGYTQKAGHNLIASASKGDRNLIAVICGCDERSKRYRSAVDLFELAFNEVKQVRVLLSKESDLFHNEIEGAKNSLLAAMESDLTISFYPSEEPILLPKIEWMSLQLPVLPGQKVGQVYAVDGKGRKWEGRSLIATKQVDPTWGYMVHQYLDNMKGWIKGHKVYIGYGVGICLVCTAFKLLKRKRLKRRRDRIL